MTFSNENEKEGLARARAMEAHQRGQAQLAGIGNSIGHGFPDVNECERRLIMLECLKLASGSTSTVDRAKEMFDAIIAAGKESK